MTFDTVEVRSSSLLVPTILFNKLTKPIAEAIGDCHYWVAQGYCF
jgi:hypothetical protein